MTYRKPVGRRSAPITRRPAVTTPRVISRKPAVRRTEHS